MQRLLAVGLAVVAIAVPMASASIDAAPPPAGAVSRLVPPPDGQCYFGFTFRTWDTSDPAWGDTRPFKERIQDSIKSELGGKTPTFLTVWATWQFPDRSGKPLVPFSSAYNDINTVKAATGANSLVYLDWNLTLTTSTNGGITVKDVASGSLDTYIRAYATEIKRYANPVLIRLFGGEFNGSWWYGQSPFANPTSLQRTSPTPGDASSTSSARLVR